MIPMDQAQNDHLKAYGIAYYSLTKGINVEWLLNYRGGAFLFDENQLIISECKIRGISFEKINTSDLVRLYSVIDQNNMDIVLLEKNPKIAIYTPPNKQPWDDAVTLALTYAEVDYETLWDEEVHLGKLEKYDWLHLHHEDFTGQYGKFIEAIETHNGIKTKKFNLKMLLRNLVMKVCTNKKKVLPESLKIMLVMVDSFLPCAQLQIHMILHSQ